MVRRFVIAALVMCPLVALAQAPQLLGYQGRLVKMDGTPESGNAQMRFGLFGTETGGSALWEETQAVSVTQGYYSTYLGRLTMFPATLFDTGTLWLEVSVQAPGDTQFRTMTPRQRVGSVAFALNARSVKGGTVDATSVSINGTQVIDSNGKLTAAAGYTAGPGISIDGTTRAISVNSSGCSTGQVLQWNGSAWQCATVSGGGGGGISGVTGTAPISVMNGTTAPVISVTVGTTTGTVAAGDDSRFGNASSLGGRAVATTAPDAGQVLTWNGSAWAPQSPATGGGGSSGPSTVGGLIASYDFEQTVSPILDSSGLANSATFTGGLTLGALGHTGSGANFSGGVATVAMGNTIPDSPTVQVEAWIRPLSATAVGSNVILSKQGSWVVRHLTGAAGLSDIEFTVTTQFAQPNCTVATSGARISTTEFTHVRAAYDGLVARIELNGQSYAQVTCRKGPLAATPGGVLTMGGPSSAGERYLGFLDSVRVRTISSVSPSRGCPPGWVDLGPSCMNPDLTRTGSYTIALNTCFAERGRMCDMQEMTFACLNSATLGITMPVDVFFYTGTIQYRYWGDTYYIGNEIFGRRAFGCVSPYGPNPGGVSGSVSWSDPSTVRNVACCRSYQN